MWSGRQTVCTACTAAVSRRRSSMRRRRAVVLPEHKMCTGCDAMLPAAAFHRRHQARDGLAARCKACTATYNKQRTEPLVKFPVAEQRCCSCERTLPAADFGNAATSSGLTVVCRQCDAKRNLKKYHERRRQQLKRQP